MAESTAIQLKRRRGLVAVALRRLRGDVPFYLLLLSVSFLLLFPFYWGFITSLKFEKEIFDFTGNLLWVKNPSLANYQTLFKTPRFFIWLRNTMHVSTVTTVLSVVVSIMAGYSIARLKFRGVTAASVIVFVTYLAPKGLLFVPLAQILNDWDLLGGLPALMITYPTFLIPFCTWLLSGYFSNVPVEPEECAMIDGASRIGAIIRVTLPMAWPGILTAAIFSFTLSWNELLYSLAFVRGEENRLLTNGVMSAFARSDIYFWGPLMAASTLASVPVALLYFLFMDRFVGGITAGATKG
jgi:multiple sugar transport system permease protein